MTKIPGINYGALINALQRDGWVVVRQKGSHIRMQKHMQAETLKLTIPAHKPIKRSTLSHILKQAHLTVEELDKLL
ncbi:type II toxin-antitoxin system HicA family toxin [Methanogenium organophilum]|uniref:Type II toxin-antitoxin system HicA family toxin n=1 Tax=Methanogenium organophilum TaxID=2199 RepID=A0A9X9S4Z4_METOG|nr:type II toxin-antitoxin system HicA family toxin [Methanogenium organophilum]WAI01771.1 type II toxin-antitoxin system HicA family toxin [Methanogenium organophilum]